VVLVGLMGSGKTTVGRKLAALIDRPFVDADEELEARSGRTVADWFAQAGEAGFRAAESDLLTSLLDSEQATVIGSGGGVVVTEANRRRLGHDDVTVVYLHGDPAFLGSRAKAKAHRPLLAGDPAEVLAQMYAERDRWYREVADLVIEVRPAHEAGDRPKWTLARQVADALVARGDVDEATVRP
jgi:shikimate kinase